MCQLLAACAVLVTVNPAFADDKPKPNTLTAKEIAEGWVLLLDGETTFGWKIDGAARVEDGVLVLGRVGKKTIAYPTAAFGQYWELSFQIIGPALIHESGTIEHPAKLDKWVTYKFNHNVELHQIHSSHSVVTSVTGTRPKGSEAAVFCIETNGEVEVKIQLVKLKPIASKPLFTGKNLDGWTVNAADPKRTASRFEVTKDGELSVKNGPGDLVTDKEFDNFVLQVECKTLGKGLNSGIFFRCIPGQYQNGYEAQVHNLYKGDDRTKPVDFGTGAIYRRVPARKVVSNDNEWFTITVAANGKHFATWVNGFQTVDWVDERPADDNPRKGYRAAKGTISIQGHDPTTDLLFRNIRIAELPAK